MARIRSIKPEFWTDEKVVRLSPLARLLFIGLWNFVDDDGRGEFSPMRLKMQILPADSADVSALLGEIRGEQLITVYSIDDKEYFSVNGFQKHQKVDKRTPSKLPSPPSSPEFPRVPPTDQGREGIKEEEGRDDVVERAHEVSKPEEDELHRAAGSALSASPGLFVMAEPMRWKREGMDWKLDVLPAIAAAVKGRRDGSIKSWGYFSQAIADWHARRLAPMPKGTGPPRNGIAKPSTAESAVNVLESLKSTPRPPKPDFGDSSSALGGDYRRAG